MTQRTYRHCERSEAFRVLIVIDIRRMVCYNIIECRLHYVALRIRRYVNGSRHFLIYNKYLICFYGILLMRLVAPSETESD